MYELENDTRGIGEFEFLGNPIFERMYELDNDTGGIGALEFFGNTRFDNCTSLTTIPEGLGNLRSSVTCEPLEWSTIPWGHC